MGGVANTLEGAVSYATGKITQTTAKFVDKALGLDKIAEEIDRVGGQMVEVGKVLNGQYHEDAKKIAEMQKGVNEQVDAYNGNVDKLVNRINDLIAFHEIFKMAASNKLDAYVGQYGPQIDALISQLKAAMAQLQSDYEFILGMAEGNWVERLAASLTMIVGGIMSDLSDVMSGKADSATWKRIITDIVLVIMVVFCWWNPLGWSAGTALVMLSLSILSAVITMDGMYANGAATGVVMGILDTIFNDILNLDDRIGSDFNKFDKDSEDYQEMVMYVQLAIALAMIYTGMTAETGATEVGASAVAVEGGAAEMTEVVSTESGFVNAASVAGKEALGATTTTSYLGGLAEINKANMMNSTIVGVKLSTYSEIYKAYSTAQSVNDVVSMNENNDALKKKLREDQLKVEEAINSKQRKGFVKSYKDTAYFLQDQQEQLNRYLWSMTAQNMYVDPYGTTPVANSRFTPDKDTRMMSFGYEEMFDESKMAGSRSYFSNIIYG